MADPVLLSKEDRTFSFGDGPDISLSGYGKSSSAKEKQVDPAEPSRPELERRTSSMRKGPPRLSGGSVHFNPDHVNIALPYDSTRPVSDTTYTSSNFIPYAESSKSPPLDRDIRDGTEEPSDYDVFLQKSREEYERDKQRNWPTVEIEDASFSNGPSSSHNADRRKLFATVRMILRILQVVMSLVVLSMVSLTISSVRDTADSATTNGPSLWPDPLSLWPEYYVAAISGLSFLTSLLSVMANFFIDKLSETKNRLGLLINFGLNLILFVAWVTAIAIFKANSSTQFVWGFACSQQSPNNPLVSYDFICNRETATWAITILSAILETGILAAFILTFVRYQAYQAEKEEARRQAEMRLSVHRAMTGRGTRGFSGRGRVRKGWEAGGEMVRPVIQVHGT